MRLNGAERLDGDASAASPIEHFPCMPTALKASLKAIPGIDPSKIAPEVMNVLREAAGSSQVGASQKCASSKSPISADATPALQGHHLPELQQLPPPFKPQARDRQRGQQLTPTVDSQGLASTINLAHLMKNRNKCDEAIKLYREILIHQPENTEVLNCLGLCLRQLGRIDEAYECYTAALSVKPQDASALNNCGVLLKDENRLEESILFYRAAVACNHDDVVARQNLAVALTDLGTHTKLGNDAATGIKHYLSAIDVKEDYAPAHYNLGVVYSELGRYDDALVAYEHAIRHNPYYVEAFCNIGVIHKNLGRLEQAIELYEKALSVNGNFQIGRSNMAIALTDKATKVKTLGNVQEGIMLYNRALVYNSQYPDAYYNLGVAYAEIGRLDEAIVCYELATVFNPQCTEAYNNLGVIFKDRDNIARAVQCYQMALSIDPKFAQTQNNIAVIYTMQGLLDEALAHCKAAIEACPTYAEVYNNLGVLYRDEGQIAISIDYYDKCLQLCPLSRNALQNRLLAFNYLMCFSNSRVFDEHRRWGLIFQEQFEQGAAPRNDRSPDRRLNIGYISADFFTHSVSYFIEGPLRHHRRDHVKVVCYSNVMRKDKKTELLLGLADEWRDVFNVDTDTVARMIRDDGIDILVELTGHTAGNRLDVLALKPAPVQVTWIGYPNTTGLPTIDYRITDASADPLDTEQQYTETLVRMPHNFLCYTPSPEVKEPSPPPVLQCQVVSFGTFNNLAKMDDAVIELWCRVLTAVPHSRLIVKNKPFACKRVQDQFMARFEAHGISASRIDLMQLMPATADHMSAYSLVDISLDTFPYAGTTTTCEAMYMGVPVITLRGHNHAHNVGVSLLRAVGMESLIADTPDEYVAIATRLSSDIPRLQEIHATLRQRMLDSSLCQCPRFVADLEDEYRKMWKTWLKQHKE